MALDVVRLLDSDFFAISTGEEFKAGVALWAKSWNQLPAASLPNNDRILAHLSGSGTRWPKIKEMALHGWIECTDGRLYHPVVADKAVEAWDRRNEWNDVQENKNARQQRWRERCKSLSAKLRTVGVTPPKGASLQTLEDLCRSHGIDVETPKVDGEASTPASTVDAGEIGKTGTGTGTGILEESYALPGSAKPKPVSGPSVEETREAFDQWNALARRAGLPTARDFTDDRRKRIASRLRAAGPDGWASVLATIEASDFCRGGGERGWRIALDDLFATKTWNKLRDGGYGAVVVPGADEIKPEVWAQLVTMWRNGEPWPETAGPAPDQPGTRAPRELLIQHVAANANDQHRGVA